MDKPFPANFERYLRATDYIDADHPLVIDYAREHATANAPIDQAVQLYYAIREGFKYNPYELVLTKEGLKASNLLKKDSGYCVEKANLLAACCRSLGIPSRLGFGIVKNHIGVEQVLKHLKTDLLVFHGYAELYLEGQWVKATPAFNKELCEHYQVEPLEFDGQHDSLFQEYNSFGHQFMEYKHEYGSFEDLPRDLFISELKKYYPHIFEDLNNHEYKFVITTDA
ncbi:MAG: transglutaminase-like domain-containing protein [Cyclobacteriaceae bacterium]